jgi:hypothetical protein
MLYDADVEERCEQRQIFRQNLHSQKIAGSETVTYAGIDHPVSMIAS